MEGLIGGAIIGVTAALLGPPLVSSLSKVVSPVGEKIAQASWAAMGAVAGLVSSIGSMVGGLAESGRGSDQKSSSEEGGFIEKIEEFGKDVAIDLVEGEAATFIKIVLLAAL